MANGTIAFDTLTTSDSVKTGTEKSVDTSYIYNGVTKHWISYEMNESSPSAAESLNHSSITDNNNGCHTITMASAMATTDYCTLSGNGRGASSAYAFAMMQMNQSATEEANTTTTYTFLGVDYAASTLTDFNTMSVGVYGDLA